MNLSERIKHFRKKLELKPINEILPESELLNQFHQFELTEFEDAENEYVQNIQFDENGECEIEIKPPQDGFMIDRIGGNLPFGTSFTVTTSN
ncbi:MAG: hypothetical protein GY739_19085 [Mesoflavibacter sp.]|nr:hypothetical protein [Mesoflavibacter sp.]